MSGLRRTMMTAAALACLGCGVKTGDVSGTVTYKGKLLPTGAVTFLDANKQPVGSSPIRDGNYSVSKVPVGTITILVTTPPLPTQRNVPRPPPPRGKPLPKDQPLPEFNPDKQPVATITVPTKYSDPEKSGLAYTARPGSQTHKIELE